jgi:hypothetical protein
MPADSHSQGEHYARRDCRRPRKINIQKRNVLPFSPPAGAGRSSAPRCGAARIRCIATNIRSAFPGNPPSFPCFTHVSVARRSIAEAEIPMGEIPEKRTSLWVWGLLLPFIALLWLPFYTSREPSLFGFPFFYWYQFAWVPLTSLLIYLAYRAVK